jgi:hypothetical protein
MGGGGSGKTTSTTQNYSPEEAARRARVMDEAGAVYSNVKDTTANAPYPGAGPVGFSPESQLAQQYVTNYASGDAANTVRDLNSAVRFGLKDVLSVNSNPYLREAVQGAQSSLAQNYTDPGGIMSSIRTGSQNAGQYGGSRQALAEGVAAGRFAKESSNLANQMYSDAYKTGLNTFGQTMEFAPAALEANTVPAQMLSSVGAQKENLAQQIANYDAETRAWDLNKDWSALQNYANIVFGAGGSQSTTSANAPRQSAFGQVASGVGLAASLAGLFSLSDRRLKYNIQRIGETLSGIPVYIWRYVWGTSGIGVMADEVTHIPGAVVYGSDGYARVNYAIL